MLKILPPNISNLIAAGEVVQRPSSVVKELLENAIDAGAASVSVIIEDAGKTLIQVIDDGCGMTPEEARLCFERHATSKIAQASDLDSILTYGFRGEALPSIAAVAEVTLRTRRKGSETGTETVFTPSGLVSQEEAAMPEGTNIAVRNFPLSVAELRRRTKIAEGGSVYLNLRTRDVTKTGDLIEFGHSAGVDYSRSAREATAELGKEVCDAVVDYTLRFIDEFVNFEFDFKK